MAEKLDVVVPDGTKKRIAQIANQRNQKASELVRDAVLGSLSSDVPIYPRENWPLHDALEEILASPEARVVVTLIGSLSRDLQRADERSKRSG